MREYFVLEYLGFERSERYLATQLTVWANLAQYTKDAHKRLSELDTRYWDQVFPWDFYHRLHEANLTDEELAEMGKTRVLTGTEALVALFQKMQEDGEI